MTRPRVLLTEADHLQYIDRYVEDPTWFKRMQIRRQVWFDRIYRRFDLVGFEEVADWRFGVANSIPREETFRNLLDAIRYGEFGMGPKIRIVCMPNKTDMYGPGGFHLLRYVGQILHAAESNVDYLRDLYAPRDLVRRWFQARELKLPPWLEPTQPSSSAQEKETTQPGSSVQKQPNGATNNYYTLPEMSPSKRQRDRLATYTALLRIYPNRRIPKMSAEELAKTVTRERRKDGSLSVTNVVSRDSVLRALRLKK